MVGKHTLWRGDCFPNPPLIHDLFPRIFWGQRKGNLMIHNDSTDGTAAAAREPVAEIPGNRLLAQFPAAQRDCLCQHSEIVALRAGEVVCDPGKPNEHVYFPESGILSSVIVLSNGASVETAIIGNEGMAGIPAIFNLPGTFTRVIQRMEGQARRIRASDVQALLADNPESRDIIARYILTLFQQCSQNAACNLHHQLEARMCRWLVSTADRARGLEFRLTQEFLSEMLGVSRQSINTTAGALQNRGLISHRRGRIEIADRARLEARACECYQATRQAYRQLMRS